MSTSLRSVVFKLAIIALVPGTFLQAQLQPPAVPDKLVVLTFDDSVRSHFSVVRPLLLRHGFGATFFITEGFDFPTNKTDYMTWDQIARLHEDGFEVGNHTGSHLAIKDGNVDQLESELEQIAAKCAEHGIPRPTSFAWPGNSITHLAFPALRKHGITLARRGGGPEFPYKEGRGFALEPGLDHPLLIPSAGDARPTWELADLIRAVEQARNGRIAVLQFHGVPDRAHPWVNTDQDKFVAFLNYLKQEDFSVVALRDIQKYLPSGSEPKNWKGVMDDRIATILNGETRDNFRTLNTSNARRWLQNMAVDHRFTTAEISAATGMTASQVDAALAQHGINRQQFPKREPNASLRILPYPGGRHPRIGFRDGMIRPQRETKFSVFLPWSPSEYVVADIPEAIWFEPDGKRTLLFLGHTHVPTIWDQTKQQVRRKEWNWKDGQLDITRPLPNGVTFGAEVRATKNAVEMRLWIENGSKHKLTGLRVQNCVMLRAAGEFNQQTNDNKILKPSYAACRNAEGNRWIITAWSNTNRSWGNDACPCLHADPQFPDCEPGERKTLVGRIWFYEGNDIETEFDRLDRSEWWKRP